MPFFGVPIRNGLPLGLGSVVGLSRPTAAPAPPPPVTSDPFFEYVPLLLNTTSTNGAQNNTFLDSSTNNFTVTRNGDTTQGSFNPYMPTGYWSGFFDGNGDFLSVPDNAAWAFGTGDFTIEAWINLSALSAFQRIVSQQVTTTGIIFRVENTNKLAFYVNNTLIATATTTFTVGQWYHVAVARSGSTLQLFVNGTSEASVSNSTNIADIADVLTIGAYSNLSEYFSGYLSNVRIVKGTAVYTAAFTPSTTPLTAITNTSLLCLQDNRFKDNSTNNFTITRNGDTRISKFAPFNPPASYSTASYGGSGYFDGTGDYLGIADSTAFDLNSTFTVECWFYQPAAGNGMFFGRGGGASSWSNSNGHEYLLFIDTGALYWQFNNGSGSSPASISTTAPAAGQWHHIAVGYNGTTTRVWLNGNSIGTSATAYNLPTTRNITRIGESPSGGTSVTGYISNARIVKGTDVYGVGNTTITPPTTPLTAITNTSLLLNFTNAGIYDASTINDAQTVGNAQVSTTQAKFGTTSMYFDGTGDALTLPTNAAYSFGGDFTIECWVYYSSSAIQALLDTRNTDSLSAYILAINASDKLDFIYGSLVRVTSATSIPKNQWVHVAVSRSSGTIRLFIDGVLDANTASTTAAINAASFPSIGGGRSTVANSVTGYYLNGYIDELRITNGYARYTGNFTPPSAAFPTL
jgi:hypothetical protein